LLSLCLFFPKWQFGQNAAETEVRSLVAEFENALISKDRKRLVELSPFWKSKNQYWKRHLKRQSSKNGLKITKSTVTKVISLSQDTAWVRASREIYDPKKKRTIV